MRYGLTLLTPPTVEPVTIAEARKHVELPAGYTKHDDHLARLVKAARQRAEAMTGRQICTATWDLFLDSFDYDEQCFYLPKPPLQSVTSITYVDTNGATQTWSSANYTVSVSREPGRVSLAYGVAYPSIRFQSDAVRVRYVAGYGVAAAVPDALKEAILLMVGHWFDHREDVIVGTITSEMPNAARDLLMQYQCGDEFVAYAEAY